MSASTSPTTYGLLGMLAGRSWTGYELTQQVRRSLRFIWPVSEGHLYREQKRLVDLGWATVEEEPAGQRSRKRYSITADGRDALSIGSPPTRGTALPGRGSPAALLRQPRRPGDLRSSWRRRPRREAMLAECWATSMSTSQRVVRCRCSKWAGRGEREFPGRTMIPERLHVVTLAIDITTQMLEQVESFFRDEAPTVLAEQFTDPVATRRRLEGILARAGRARAGQAGAAEQA